MGISRFTLDCRGGWPTLRAFRRVGFPRRRRHGFEDHYSLFLKVVRVNALQLVNLVFRNADAMLQHERGKLLSIDQDHSIFDGLDVVPSGLRKAAGRNEYYFSRSFPLESPHELLNMLREPMYYAVG